MKSLLRRAYFSLGVDFRKVEIVARAIHMLWNRPFYRLPLRGVGAEIGVYRGVHAKSILRLHPEIEELWLVDSYQPYALNAGGALPFLQDARWGAHRCLRHEKRVRWMEESSPGCIHKLPELDFAYIDAGHSHESVSSDLKAVWPKIKPGGIVGGHDFAHWWPGLIGAVIEFAVEKNLQLYATTPDWWMVKPEANPRSVKK